MRTRDLTYRVFDTVTKNDRGEVIGGTDRVTAPSSREALDKWGSGPFVRNDESRRVSRYNAGHADAKSGRVGLGGVNPAVRTLPIAAGLQSEVPYIPKGGAS